MAGHATRGATRLLEVKGSLRPRVFVVESSRRMTGSGREVMQHVVRPRTWPVWQPEILSARGPEILRTGAVVEGHAKLLGFHVQGQSRAVEVQEEVFEEDVIVGVRMRVRYEVREGDQDVVVTRRLESELPGGVSGRLLSFFLRRRLRRMQSKVLDNLVGQAEAPSS